MYYSFGPCCQQWDSIISLVVVCRSLMATLHGDHTIRITEISSGRNIQTLVGHPRSPWSVEFHKYHCNILVSGCLAGQVRIWDLTVSYYMYNSHHISIIQCNL